MAAAQRIDQPDTPSVVVDLDVSESNVAELMGRLASVRVRPHLKTAKSRAVRLRPMPSHASRRSAIGLR